MSHNRVFGAVVVYPEAISPKERGVVGIWLGQVVPPRLRRKIMELNSHPDFVLGHIGVGVDPKTRTTRVWFAAAHIRNQASAKKAAIALRRAVCKIAKTTAFLVELPNYRAVSKALAEGIR